MTIEEILERSTGRVGTIPRTDWTGCGGFGGVSDREQRWIVDAGQCGANCDGERKRPCWDCPLFLWYASRQMNEGTVYQCNEMKDNSMQSTMIDPLQQQPAQ